MISGRQLLLLMVGSVTVMGHLFFVPQILKAAGRDGWITIPVATIPALLMVFVFRSLAVSYPGLSLPEIVNCLLGKPVEKLSGLIYGGFFLLAPAITLKGLMDFMNTAFLPSTPPLVLGSVFFLVCFLAALGGLPYISRVNQLLLPLLTIMGIMAFSLTLPGKDYRNLLPVLENGFTPVLAGGVPLLGLLAEMAAVGFILPYLKNGDTLLKSAVPAILIAAIMFAGPLTGPVAMFGEKLPANLSYPTFYELEGIQIGGLGQNLQVLAISLWLLGSFGRISFFYYISALIFSGILGLNGKDSHKAVAPVGAAIMALSLSFPNILVVKRFLTGVYPAISIFLGILFPVFLLALARVRGYPR